MELGAVRVGNSAGAKLHEESHGGRAAGTAIGPEYDVVGVGVVPALEEVEEQVARFDVDVARV